MSVGRYSRMRGTSRTMTVPRALLVLAMLASVGVATVLLRADTARAAHRVQRLHQHKIELSHQLWSVEMDLARLRAPERIRKRASDLGLDVHPPVVEPASDGRRKTGGR